MGNIKTLPPQAFDGQIFIDAFRVKWRFDGSTKCWKKIGQCSEIPVASEMQTGLLSAKLKQLLDGIPEGGGHFGIVAQPLLSLVPQNPNILHKGKVYKSILTDSGTKIIEQPERDFTPEQFVGKILIFKTGILTKKAFLIFTNDKDTIFIEGDATAASKDDCFDIVESTDLNPSGVLLGDIMLVSESIDITCVDGEGLPLKDKYCPNLDTIQCDNVQNPPGLNFQINENFLNTLCVTVPGCKGPTGERGDQGDTGPDGTGDGPQGEQGDPGMDATIAGTFTGIKIIDIDDIYDTAIVSMELDADAGQLNIVRAKVRTPDTNTAATQLISTPINRTIKFLNNTSFEYELMKPTIDPIDELDPDILKYPRQYAQPDSGEVPRTTIVGKIKLSEIVNAVIAHYEEKLSTINDQYNQDLKAYIENKDEAARQALASLAQQVAECEFELPIDFCLGITPSECNTNPSRPQSSNAEQDFAFGMCEQILSVPNATAGGGDVGAKSLGIYCIPPTVTGGQIPAGEEELVEVEFGEGDLEEGPTLVPPQMDTPTRTSGETFVTVKFPSNTSRNNTSTLPCGLYVIKILGESSAIRSDETSGWIISSEEDGEGLEAVITEGDGTPYVAKGSVPSIQFNPLEKTSVEKAYSEADFAEQVITVELVEPGRINLCAFVPGSRAQGEIKVEVLMLNAPDGTTFLV